MANGKGSQASRTALLVIGFLVLAAVLVALAIELLLL